MGVVEVVVALITVIPERLVVTVVVDKAGVGVL
jgi:hypothetical protein